MISEDFSRNFLEKSIETTFSYIDFSLYCSIFSRKLLFLPKKLLFPKEKQELGKILKTLSLYLKSPDFPNENKEALIDFSQDFFKTSGISSIILENDRLFSLTIETKDLFSLFLMNFIVYPEILIEKLAFYLGNSYNSEKSLWEIQIFIRILISYAKTGILIDFPNEFPEELDIPSIMKKDPIVFIRKNLYFI